MVKMDWLKVKTREEKAVMIKRAQTARMIIIFGCSGMLLVVIVVVIPPIFGVSLRYLTNVTDSERFLPLQSYYFYDINSSPIFEIIFVLQSFGSLILATIYTCIDTFMTFLILHVCGQLENLKMRIFDLDKFINVCTDVSSIVQDHIRLIK